MKTISGVLILFAIILTVSTNAQSKSGSKDTLSSVSKQQQLIIWTSGDREVALKMVFMYAFNCRKYSWMDNVRLLIWGPSDKLLVEDTELQKQLKELKNAGVELYACKGCADLYGVSNKLTKLGITVMYTGKMLADLQKDGWHVISF
jgi:hypothetical protein